MSLRNANADNAHFWSASILNSIFLLTAAHCITDLNLKADQIRTHAGEYKLNENDANEQVRNVSRIILHGGWNESSTSYDNDIAILLLDRPLVFDRYTRPIGIAKGGEMWTSKLANISVTKLICNCQ